jgi:hypothetical protein
VAFRLDFPLRTSLIIPRGATIQSVIITITIIIIIITGIRSLLV